MSRKSAQWEPRWYVADGRTDMTKVIDAFHDKNATNPYSAVNTLG
jgi:hypothetical protein